MLSGACRLAVVRARATSALERYAHELAERGRLRDGQDMVEYAGVLLVVAAIVLALATFGKPIASSIAHGITTEISKIFSGS